MKPACGPAAPATPTTTLRLPSLLLLQLLLLLTRRPVAMAATSNRLPALITAARVHTASARSSHSVAFATRAPPSTSSSSSSVVSPLPPPSSRPPPPPLTLDASTTQRLWGVKPEEMTCLPRAVWKAKAREHKAKMLTLMGGSTRHDHGNPVRREGGRQGEGVGREGRMCHDKLVPMTLPT